MKKIALIGIGNILFCDEGIGAYIVTYIEKNYKIPENLTIIEGGTLGFSLMMYFNEYDKIFLISTSSKKGDFGDIFIQNANEILNQGKLRKTANETEILMMIEIYSFHQDMPEISLISIIPKDIETVKNSITKELLEKSQNIIETVKKELKKENIILEKRDKEIKIEEIIKEYANPKIKS